MDKGTVSFVPLAGGPVAYGHIQPGGLYELRVGSRIGLPAGTYKVLIVAYELLSPSDDQSPSRLLTPARYADKAATPLEQRVTPGRQTVELALEPDPQ